MRLQEISKALSLESASRGMQIQGLANSIETERVSRRADSGKYQAAIEDIRVSLEDVDKRCVSLVELALHMRPAKDESIAEGKKGIMRGVASAQTLLSDDAAVEQAASETSAGDSSFCITDRRAEIAEWTKKLTAAQLELREELNSRVNAAVASIQGNLAAQAAELRCDIAASQAELRDDFAKIRSELTSSQTSAAGLGLPSNTALVSQLKEFAGFIEVLSTSTGRLNDKLSSEIKGRRQVEMQLNARISRVEQRLAGASQEDSEEQQREEVLLHDSPQHAKGVEAAAGQANCSNIQRQQSSMKEEIKQSLEQLVHRLGGVLDTAGDSSARARSLSPTGPSHHRAMMIASASRARSPRMRSTLPHSPLLALRSGIPESPPVPLRSSFPHARTTTSPLMSQRSLRPEPVPAQPCLALVATPRQCTRPCNQQLAGVLSQHAQSQADLRHQLAGALSQHAQNQADLRRIPKAHGHMSPRLQGPVTYAPPCSAPARAPGTGTTPPAVLNWR